MSSEGKEKDKHTIMPTPTEAWAPALSPSERFSVTERPNNAVSEDRRFISSPVLVLSKKATSCFRIEEKIFCLNCFTILCPKRKKNGFPEKINISKPPPPPLLTLWKTGIGLFRLNHTGVLQNPKIQTKWMYPDVHRHLVSPAAAQLSWVIACAMCMLVRGKLPHTG